MWLKCVIDSTMDIIFQSKVNNTNVNSKGMTEKSQKKILKQSNE